MKRQYSLAYLTLPGISPPEQVEIAAKAGYDFVGLRLIPFGVPGEPEEDVLAPALLRRTREVLTCTGLGVLDIELARITRDIAPRDFLPALEAGAELGARHLITSAWTDARNDKDFIVARYGEICDLARPLGLTVDIEFPAFSRLCDLDDALEILDAARRPNAGLLIDTLYYHFSHVDLPALARVPAHLIHFLHLCDAPAQIPYTRADMMHIAREERLYVGEGVIDFAALLACLPAVPLSIELPNVRRLAELGALEHARRSLATARAHLEPTPQLA